MATEGVVLVLRKDCWVSVVSVLFAVGCRRVKFVPLLSDGCLVFYTDISDYRGDERGAIRRSRAGAWQLRCKASVHFQRLGI